jgi:hypothetical protein
MAASRTKRFASRASVMVAAMGLVLSMAGSALAAVPLTTVSTDPYTNLSSAHQTQLEPDNFSFGSTIVAVFQSGRFFNGGASNIGYATSTNNGSTWTNGFLPSTTVYATPPGPWDRISDPSVSFDAKHNVWMVTGLAITGTIGIAVLVSRSTDGGLTFGNPVTVKQKSGGFYDKEWIACDNTPASPHYGNCYVQWDDAFSSNLLHMSFSTDGGQSWTDSAVPGNAFGVIGGQPLVQPDGTVVVPIGGGIGIESFTSTNGGTSYTGPFGISNVSVHGVAGGLRDGGGLPSAEIDASGKIYVVWQDCRFRSGCSANDIVMSTSTNGQTWTALVRIPIDATTSGVDHFIPGLGVDHSTSGSSAHLGLTYYFYPVASCSASTCKLSVGFVSSSNGGGTWSGPVKLFGRIRLAWIAPTSQGSMVGYYISTAYGSNGRAYPVIAQATRTTQCTANTLGSCHEFMVAPTNGLLSAGGNVRVIPADPVLATRGDRVASGTPTAF